MKRRNNIWMLLVALSSLAVGCNQKKPIESNTITNESTTVNTENKDEYFVFEPNGDGTCTVTDCGNAEEISVPEYSPKGYMVTSVNFRRSNDKVKKITLPSTLTSVGYSCFFGWTSLEDIILPNSIKTIDSQAFKGCTSLKDVTLPRELMELASYTFEGCTSLKDITLPKTLSILEPYAFEDCTALTSIQIPDGVETIGEYAFNGCSSLTEVNFPSKLKSIENNAFQGCTKLNNVVLPETIENLFAYSFSDCKALTSIRIPKNVRLVAAAFYGCDNLTDVTLDDGVKYIANNAFKECEIKKIFIPSSVIFPGSRVFEGCPKDLAIYCEAKTKPENWNDEWNYISVTEQFKTVFDSKREMAD